MNLTHLTTIKLKKLDVPFIVWIVIISTFTAVAGDFTVLGYRIAGWAWVIPLVFSSLIFLRRPSRVSLPVLVWAPWICVISFYFLNSGFSYLQRNLILVSPIIVGMAVSISRIRDIQIRSFLVLTNILLYGLFLMVIIKTGLLFTGILPSVTGLAVQSITASLLCCIFAVGYSVNRRKDLLHWIIGAAIPIIALTRTAILATFLTMPLTFASLTIRKRLVFLVIIGALSISLFYTERVQKKMFYSGVGRTEDLWFSNPNLRTAGRSQLWDRMVEEIKAKPIWGHGSNASEEFVLSMTWGMLTHPHNDWLRLLYDYGFVGASIFAFCLVAQVVHLLKRVKKTFGNSRILLYAGASSFLPFVLFMFTDNIILYATFFGNLQFTILGLLYASQKTCEIDAQYHVRTFSPDFTENILHKLGKQELALKHLQK